MQRSEDVQSNMQTVDNDIKQIVVQLDAIGASLDELTRPGQADAKQAFDVFSENVSKIEKMEKDFSKHADQMTKSGKKYFEEWDKKNNQYDNPEIQRSSDARRADLDRTYDKIGENNKGVKEAFRTYVSDVTKIEAYISNDLTTKGITSIASLSDRVVRNGNHLKNEMENQFKACWEVFFCTLSTIHSLLVACKTNQRCQFLNQVHLKQNRVLITVSLAP